MNVKVINCYRLKLEEDLEEWISSLAEIPSITHTNMTQNEHDHVCFVIFYKFDARFLDEK